MKVHNGTYRAQPSRRCHIPKSDGSQRTLGIAALEDKIIQHAVATVLNAIYETDFKGFSFGFRPGRSQHDALDALNAGLMKRKVNWVLDADIQGYFDHIDHKWLLKFLQHRIADKRVLRLIKQWLMAGTVEAGQWRETKAGCPQGSVISPLLANIYLHYVLDLWVEPYRNRKACGEVIIVRYADDFIVGFQYQNDAVEFRGMLEKRLKKFQLKMHPKKTQLIRFGRFAESRCKEMGLGKPKTFVFLGFRHICSHTRQGVFVVKRQTDKKRMRKKLQEIKQTLMKNRHASVVKQGEWLRRVVQGYLNYHAVPWNLEVLDGFRNNVCRYWLKALGRRSQRHRLTWIKFSKLVRLFIPTVKLLHEYPVKRFDAKYSR